MLREPHTLGRQPVDVWRPDFLLALAAQFTPSQVVGKDEDNVRTLGRGRPDLQPRERNQGKSKTGADQTAGASEWPDDAPEKRGFHG